MAVRLNTRMKLKQSPDDFVVEERTDVAPGGDGEFAFYRLDKVGWTTPDAVNAVRRRWQLDRRRVSYGGLKDRHARTTQYLTVYRGPRRNLTHERIDVTYLGQVREPYTAADIARLSTTASVAKGSTRLAAEAGVSAPTETAGAGAANARERRCASAYAQ